MIQFMHGNLFDSGADILVNTVNCVGVMGKGVALEFKRRWPEMFAAYKYACVRGAVSPGRLHIWNGDAWIINLPTKRHWRDNSRYDDVAAGLNALREYLIGVGHPHTSTRSATVAMPPPGCGNGGLDWARVKPMVVDALGSLPNTIYVFES